MTTIAPLLSSSAARVCSGSVNIWQVGRRLVEAVRGLNVSDVYVPALPPVQCRTAISPHRAPNTGDVLHSIGWRWQSRIHRGWECDEWNLSVLRVVRGVSIRLKERRVTERPCIRRRQGHEGAD